MGFFRSSFAGYAEEHSPEDPENPLSRKGRSATRRHSRRSSGDISRTSSGRSVSASTKTVKVGSGFRAFSGSNKTKATESSSSRSQSMRKSADKIRPTFNGDLSIRSFVSDLDLESAEEMAPIGENSLEDEYKRFIGLTPDPQTQTQHDTEGTSSEMYPSVDLTMGSGENQNCNNSKFSITNNSLGRSLVESSNMNEDYSSNDMDTLSVSGASVMMDKSRAENVGRSGTKFVYIVLLITGVIVYVMINIAAQRYEYKNFELEFKSLARETADLAETNAEHTFAQLQTLATTVTSEGLLHRDSIGFANSDNVPHLQHGNWPNVTVPHFDMRIDDSSKSFGPLMLMYVPMIAAKDRDSFEEYSNDHRPWEAHTDIPGLVHDHDVGHYQHIHPVVDYDEEEAKQRSFNVEEFADEILRNHSSFQNPEGLTAPIYQYGGSGHERTHQSYIALMDLMSHPIFKKEVIASIEYDVPVISEYMDVNFLLQGLMTVDSDGEHTSPVYDSHGSFDTNSELTLPSMRSLTLHPVKNSFEHNATTIGFVVGVVPWDTFFRSVIQSSEKNADDSSPVYGSSEADGIVVVVRSDCGSVFTFKLNAGTTEVRLGDWTDIYEKYRDLNLTSKFFWKSHPRGNSKHCHFDLNIYPSEDLRDEYRQNSVYYSAIVGGIFLFTALLFACYDRFIFKGQQHIVNEASGMVVQNARRAAKNERGELKRFPYWRIKCNPSVSGLGSYALCYLSAFDYFVDLNDFIAHEVRNPLAAAISACSFVSSAIMEDATNGNMEKGGDNAENIALIASDEKRKEVQDDINIIDSSLHFINDLLRNMLDIQRAGSNQISIEKKPTNIMDDIFKPVVAMLHLRDSPFEMILEIDDAINKYEDNNDNQLIVMTDSMRLKQVMLNLVRNATKFVDKGFIRCSAHINPINGMVELHVDDSGPGIAEEKRGRVFGKFQQSLDLLQQGTGIGLSLCKKMTTMMGGSLYVDEDYHSGIEGCPGTRFVIQLKTLPVQLDEMEFEPEISNLERARLRRQHLLACAESSTVNEVENEKQTDFIDSIITSSPGLKDVELGDEIQGSGPAEIRNIDTSLNTPSEAPANVVLTEKIEEASEKKEDSDTLPISVSLQQLPFDEQIGESKDQESEKPGAITELPKDLNVLFVDDDMILRKLFSRTLRKVNPTWVCKEASSGEMAIELISSNAECTEGFQDEEDGDEKPEADCGFDLIFMDQYMASVQKQLLGTETVRKIRANGYYKPIICGLSANDVEEAFYHAGSDAFMFKPFPCKKDELEKELLKVLNSRVGK